MRGDHSKKPCNTVKENVFCPGKEAAMVIIVVSLPCTAYLWATLITLQIKIQITVKTAKSYIKISLIMH